MDKYSSMVLDHTKKISALQASMKSFHKRQDDHAKILTGIHDLSKNVAAMATEVKILAENTAKSITEIKQGQRVQGERVGEIEKTILKIERNEKDILETAKKLDALRMEPAKKLKSIVMQIVGLILAAIAGGAVTGNFFM